MGTVMGTVMGTEMTTEMTTERSTERSREDLLERILQRLCPYEFKTLVLGFARAGRYDREEHEVSYRELKIALGDELVRRLPGVEVDFDRPDVRVEIGQGLEVTVRSAPLFIAGRYRKLSREIPASKWIHHACRGKGCPSCSHTGTLCGPSIEELLGAPILQASGGSEALFHALGREDTDARMLGTGRPFVLEVRSPLRRTLPLESIGNEVVERARYLAEVSGLVPVARDAVAAVKGSAAEKTYRAWVRVGGGLPTDASERAERLAGFLVEQLSPRRVMHRRGRGTTRARRILESTWAGELDGLFLWEVRVESGMYVKELVSGDEGRTRPSLAAVLGVPATCAALDVLEIHWTPPWEAARGP